MIPVAEVVPEALASVISKAPLTPEKVAFVWRLTVGPAIDRATTVDLRGGVLHVRAREAAWRREVERAAGVIRRRLQELLGRDVVRALDITLPQR